MAIKLLKNVTQVIWCHIAERNFILRKEKSWRPHITQARYFIFPRDVTILAICLTTLQLTLYPRQMLGGRWARPHHDQECLDMRIPLTLITPKPYNWTRDNWSCYFYISQAILTEKNNIFHILFCYLILIDILGEGGQVWIIKPEYWNTN